MLILSLFSTGEKPHACPDCDYRTADPGCLTRHRKRKHGYVPNRKTGKAKVSTTTINKQSRRHTPYKRKEISASPIPASELLPEAFYATMDSTYLGFGTSDATCSEAQDNMFSFTWDKNLFPLEGTSSILESRPSLDLPYSGLSPAVDTCSQLFDRIDDSFDFMDLFSQNSPSVRPAQTYLADSPPVSSDEDFSWIFDPVVIPTTVSALADDTNSYGSPESSYSADFPHYSTSPASFPESYFSDYCTDTFSSSPASAADCGFSDFIF